MAITFELEEVTPHRLRYLCSGDGAGVSPDTGILVNRDGVTADLRGDSRIYHGFAISNLVSTTVANQAAARRLMFGDTLTTRPSLEVNRADVTINPRSSHATESKWAVDATRGDLVDAQSGAFPVLVIFGPNAILQFAYLEIEFAHTFSR